MYAALWRVLPGPWWVRVLILLVLAAIILYLLYFYVFLRVLILLVLAAIILYLLYFYVFPWVFQTVWPSEESTVGGGG